MQDVGPHPGLGLHGRPRSGSQVEPAVQGQRVREGHQPFAELQLLPRDPHAAKPRIIRDGLIQALTRPEKDTLWHQDAKGAKIDVKDLGERGFTRKIAMLSRNDSKLQCAQCDVEYNCNPGTDPSTGHAVTMADARTNHPRNGS